MSFGDLKTPEGIDALNKFLADNSYIVGYVPSKADESVFEALGKCPDEKYPYINRWYRHIASFDKTEKASWGGTPITQAKETNTNTNVKSEAKPVDDDDLDLFGSDEEEDAEAERIREERVAAYSAKKSKKPALIAKSSVLLDCKPWDDETDMGEMEKAIRTIVMDGLLWGASKLVPVGYGIKKLQIMCVIEDEKVSIDLLQEKIEEFEDFVQSVDIAAFNKI